MATQSDLLPVEHRSMTTRRLTKRKQREVNPERIYQAHWLKFTRRFARGQYSLLDAILYPDDDRRHATRADAALVATFVQWLGTNVGMGFIRGAEEAIDAARERSRRIRLRGNLIERERQQLDAMRQRIAEAEQRIMARAHREIEE